MKLIVEALLTFLPLAAILDYCWDHTLLEWWPEVVPDISYWQSYLVLILVSLVFPFWMTRMWKD